MVGLKCLQYDWARELPDYNKCSANDLSFDLCISHSHGPSTALNNHLRIVFEDMSPWKTFNNVSRDENNILDQICIKKICPDFYYDDF